LDFNEVATLCSSFFGLRYNGSNLIPHKAGDVGPLFGVARSTQHGLIGVLQPVFIHRHIERGEDRHHARNRQSFAGIYVEHAGVRASGKTQLHGELPFHIEIAGIGRMTSNLGGTVKAGKCFTNIRSFHGLAPIKMIRRVCALVAGKLSGCKCYGWYALALFSVQG